MKRLHIFFLFSMIYISCIEYNPLSYNIADVFYQNPPSQVDVLIVIDNSGSMLDEQKKLGENFESFISYFLAADVNYHIGATTTDMSNCSLYCGKLREYEGYKFVTPETPDAEKIFSNIVNVGAEGGWREMGLEAALNALTPPLVNNENKGFLREEAKLALIFISDEEDWSPLPVNDYINSFRKIKGERERGLFSASAVVVDVPEGCGDYSSMGTRYIDVAEQTGGVVGSLCDEDFSHIISDLSLNVSGLKNTFELSKTPDPDSISVTVNDVEVINDETEGWVYEEDINSIVFSLFALPPVNSKIVVYYMVRSS